jgi:hypothetical protein
MRYIPSVCEIQVVKFECGILPPCHFFRNDLLCLENWSEPASAKKSDFYPVSEPIHFSNRDAAAKRRGSRPHSWNRCFLEKHAENDINTFGRGGHSDLESRLTRLDDQRRCVPLVPTSKFNVECLCTKIKRIATWRLFVLSSVTVHCA